MIDVKKATAVVVLGVYSAIFWMLIRPGSKGPSLITETGLAFAGIAA
jgi:hypothetical protein